MKTTVANPSQSVLACYNSHAQAEDAVINLSENGFDMKRFSIVSVDLYTTEKVLGYYNTGDRMRKWAISGGFWAGFWGLVFGFSTYSIPIIGPALIQGWIGALVSGIVLAVFGAAVGALAALLYNLGISDPKKIKYKTAVKAQNFLLLAQIDAEEIQQALDILHLRTPKKKHDAIDWKLANQSRLQAK